LDDIILGSDGKALNVKLLSVEGKFVQANEYGKASSEDEVQIELTEEEKAMVLQMRQVWNEILKIEIADDTDFFATGAGSMDVVRLVEEVKDKTGVEITNEDVFMATAFADFIVSIPSAKGNDFSSPLPKSFLRPKDSLEWQILLVLLFQLSKYIKCNLQ
jgi:formyltetrahydrofolate dehydrogenase